MSLFLRNTLIFSIALFSVTTFAGSTAQGPIRKIQKILGQVVVDRVVTDSVAGRCKKHFSCQNDSDRLRVQLDYRFDFDHKNRVNLVMRPDELVDFVQRPEMSAYLNQINESINLWQYSVASTHGDENKALERIAVLFQDVSKTDPDVIPPQVTYLHSRGLRFEGDLLMRALQVVRKLDPSQSFPAREYENDAGIYHFYVSAYLSKKLQSDGFASHSAALYAPFLFNLSYEAVKYDWFEKSQKSGDWADLWTMFKKLFFNRDLLYSDLRRIDPNSHEDYRGLVGTWAALAGSAWANHEKLPDLQTFTSEFSGDPNLWIEAFLN